MEKDPNVKMKSTSSALGWKLLENFGVAGVHFVLQIILARILDPEHYGVLSLMLIFVNLATVFIQNGFNTSLIQNKDVTDQDYSSVFWVTLSISGMLYAVIFLAAPVIATFYEMPSIVAPLRVIALVLFPGAYNSIQLAKVSRGLDFKKVFISNIGAIFVSGTVGIIVALNGGGLWALVAQNLINTFTACLVMSLTVRWYPRLTLNWNRIRVLFGFGWKLVVSGLIETLYQDLHSLVIGKKYDSSTLGYNNRGKQFPQFVIGAINGAIQSVMLPTMSARQDHADEVKNLMRRSMRVSSYIIFPMMAGLAAVASPLIGLILTEKWLPCVPYLQIYCFTMAFYPVHTCNLQTINAMGRSDLFLKLEIVKKCYGIIALLIAVICFDSPLGIAASGIVTTLISCFVNASPNKKLIGYSYVEQMKDILPSFLMSMVMFAAIYPIIYLNVHAVITILLQVSLGIIVYIVLSMVSKNDCFEFLLSTIAKTAKKSDRKG